MTDAERIAILERGFVNLYAAIRGKECPPETALGQATSAVSALLSAVRKHRDQHGDDRCHLDDRELYAVLPEGVGESDQRLPPREEFLGWCARYHASRQPDGMEYVSPQREIERLTTALAQKEAARQTFEDQLNDALGKLRRHDYDISQLDYALRDTRTHLSAIRASGVAETDRLCAIAGLGPWKDLIGRIERALKRAPLPPIPLLLFCPRCHVQHVDKPEPEKNWSNPPHKSHLCHGCGLVWRPADIATVGVETPATRGKEDTWP